MVGFPLNIYPMASYSMGVKPLQLYRYPMEGSFHVDWSCMKLCMQSSKWVGDILKGKRDG